MPQAKAQVGCAALGPIPSALRPVFDACLASRLAEAAERTSGAPGGRLSSRADWQTGQRQGTGRAQGRADEAYNPL